MQQTGSRRIVLATLLLLSTIILTVAFTTAGLATADPVDRPIPLAQQETPTPANNTTVQHERPESISQAGDSQQVSQWLERQLTTQLENSSTEISQGEYDRAQEYLGDDYDSRLDQYVEVAGETEGDSDDQTAETLQETQADQKAFTNATQSYQETYQEYREAREQGNTTAARQAARELEADSERVSARNESLAKNYAGIENQTGIETGQSQTRIANTTRTITAQQETVRTQTFIKTNLTVETDGSIVSFTDPMVITGQVMTVNDSVVANETVHVIVDEQTYNTTTGADGNFTIEYRPVLLPVNSTNASVQVVPQTDSPYLGTAATVTTDVEQVTPSFSLNTVPATVGYGESVKTDIVVTVDQREVPSLLIETALQNNRASGYTDSLGNVTITQRVPATLPAGRQSIRVSHARDGLAVGPGLSTTPVTITTSGTRLSVTATTQDNQVVTQGRLTTTDGRGVENQLVKVTVGSTIQSVETNKNGRYQATVSNASRFAQVNESVVPVTARFDGSGTNLETSQAETTVNVPTVNVPRATGNDSPLSAVQILAISLLALVTVLGIVYLTRSSESATDSTQPVTDTTTPTPADSSQPSRSLLTSAQSALSNDEHKRATITAYAAVRKDAQQQTDLPGSLTHQEFLTAYRPYVEDSESALLTALATAYEQAAFAGTVDLDAATDAVEAATILSDSS